MPNQQIIRFILLVMIWTTQQCVGRMTIRPLVDTLINATGIAKNDLDHIIYVTAGRHVLEFDPKLRLTKALFVRVCDEQSYDPSTSAHDIVSASKEIHHGKHSLYVTCRNGLLVRLEFSGNREDWVRTVVNEESIGVPYQLQLDRDGNFAYTVDKQGGALHKTDLKSGKVTMITPKGAIPSPQGLLLFSDEKHAIVSVGCCKENPTLFYQVDMTTGTTTPVQLDMRNHQESSPIIINPFFLAWDRVSESFYVTSRNKVFKVFISKLPAVFYLVTPIPRDYRLRSIIWSHSHFALYVLSETALVEACRFVFLCNAEDVMTDGKTVLNNLVATISSWWR